jgi:hypothetical protein
LRANPIFLLRAFALAISGSADDADSVLVDSVLAGSEVADGVASLVFFDLSLLVFVFFEDVSELGMASGSGEGSEESEASGPVFFAEQPQYMSERQTVKTPMYLRTQLNIVGLRN